ncbi:hypothetical protein HK101_011713 [Irineochytrium annulatum]|nr:hypothetical protein HK101_011713 [Irineochytrium annulatum]
MDVPFFAEGASSKKPLAESGPAKNLLADCPPRKPFTEGGPAKKDKTKPRGVNFSLAETELLLTIAWEVKPRGQNEWLDVANQFIVRVSNDRRRDGGAAFKARFNKVKTLDPVEGPFSKSVNPAVVVRAIKIQQDIDQLAGVIRSVSPVELPPHQMQRLLSWAEELLPTNARAWDELANNFNDELDEVDHRLPDFLEGAFNCLRRVAKPTGDPECPEDVRWAKRIWWTMEEKISAGDGADDVDSEEGRGGDIVEEEWDGDWDARNDEFIEELLRKEDDFDDKENINSIADPTNQVPGGDKCGVQQNQAIPAVVGDYKSGPAARRGALKAKKESMEDGKASFDKFIMMQTQRDEDREDERVRREERAELRREDMEEKRRLREEAREEARLDRERQREDKMEVARMEHEERLAEIRRKEREDDTVAKAASQQQTMMMMSFLTAALGRPVPALPTHGNNDRPDLTYVKSSHTEII